MYKLLTILLCSVVVLTGCQQKKTEGQDHAEESDSSSTIVKVHITGKVQVPDSTEVVINTDENTLKPFLKTKVVNGTFLLEGNVPESNFYNLVVQKEKFKVFLENGATYTFEGEADGQGNVQSGKMISSSKTMNDYYRFFDVLDKKKDAINAEYGGLLNAMQNPKVYQQAVEKTLALQNQRDALEDAVKKNFLNDANVQPLLKVFLIKGDKIGRQNYKRYYEILQQVPDSLRNISLYRKTSQKIDEVRNFYEQMPAFPDIHPRNPQGDSLKLASFKDKGTLLFVFWGAKNDESKEDIGMLKASAGALKKIGILPIYLTWESDYDVWKTAGDKLALGQDNYRLNATDQDFLANSYGARTLPHYILVNANDLQVINHDFKIPLNGRIVGELEKELKKN